MADLGTYVCTVCRCTSVRIVDAAYSKCYFQKTKVLVEQNRLLNSDLTFSGTYICMNNLKHTVGTYSCHLSTLFLQLSECVYIRR